MSSQAFLSVAPPLLNAHDTAAMFSPRIKIGSRAASGLSPTNSSIIHAFTIIPNNSTRLIVMIRVSRMTAFLSSSAVNYVDKTYLQSTFFSTQISPTA